MAESQAPALGPDCRQWAMSSPTFSLFQNKLGTPMPLGHWRPGETSSSFEDGSVDISRCAVAPQLNVRAKTWSQRGTRWSRTRR